MDRSSPGAAPPSALRVAVIERLKRNMRESVVVIVATIFDVSLKIVHLQGKVDFYCASIKYDESCALCFCGNCAVVNFLFWFEFDNGIRTVSKNYKRRYR